MNRLSAKKLAEMLKQKRNELDLTQESNQMKVVKQGLINQGFEEAEAEADE